MHIPDGILSAPVSVACGALATPAIFAAGARARALLGSRAAVRMGVMAAFVFAAQMLTFPVAGGTSGHLLGGVLAAVLLGPSAAVIVLSSVVVLQCLVFSDGGLFSLGANLLNMAVVQPVVGYAVYRAIAGARAPSAVRRLTAVAFASWLATVVAAGTCAGEIALSKVVAPSVVLTAMLGVHFLIGMGEGVISALVVAGVMRLRPEMLDPRPPSTAREAGSIALLALVASLAIAIFVSPFACRWPDGLERVVERLGIEPSSARVSLPAPLRDYAVPGLSGFATTAVAAAAGTLMAFVLCAALGAGLAPRRASRVQARGGPTPSGS